ncbi:uncharacterized protein L201_003350 [Kwoniella dendrophila CBS 6074]|uniref:Uncharacterized protein n=1 Tax=Kwoniella dendrophila CBS 6074 TaxID=1295534 RepID=A0AAX4JT00_9TREE
MPRPTYDLNADYPPSPPSKTRRPPPLRVNTHNPPSSSSVRSAGHSPVKPGLSYNLPTNIESPGHSQNRARPGGLAALNSDTPARVRSPPITPGSRSQSRTGQWSRRGSNESNLPPPTIRQGSDHRKTPLPSVYSGREGISHRAEGIKSPNPAHCRLFYFSPSPPEDSASYISSTLAALPPSHRAAYTRLQSSLRSLAHLHHLRLRISSFHALISSTIRSASLTPLARQDLISSKAKTERYEKASKFISTWCTSKTGGVEPFFRGLWGTLRAQSRGDASRGGGGSTRIVWEIDDAVFLESGSYSEAQARRPPRPHYGDQEELANSPPDSRSRAISDPFIDSRPRRRGPAPPPPPSRRHPPTIPNPLQREYTSSQESPDGTPQLSEDRVHLLTLSDNSDDGNLATDPLVDDDENDVAAEEVELNKPRFRLWIFPSHISDQEAEQLKSLFPRFISAKGDIRFPFVRPGRGVKAMEEATWDAIAVGNIDDTEPKVIRVPKVEIEDEEGVARCGTGRMWVGTEPRRSGWSGNGWYRFKRWWRKLFIVL